LVLVEWVCPVPEVIVVKVVVDVGGVLAVDFLGVLCLLPVPQFGVYVVFVVVCLLGETFARSVRVQRSIAVLLPF
jgi:hypothetical protein